MSSNRNIGEIASELENLAGRIHSDSVSFEERITLTSKAVELYRRFRSIFKGATLDVRALVPHRDGRYREKPFDWDSLDEGSRR